MRVIEQKIRVDFHYPVVFTDAAFLIENRCLANLLTSDGRQAKVLFVLEHALIEGHPTLLSHIQEYSSAHSLVQAGAPLVVDGGENIKNNDEILRQLYRTVAEQAIDRHSYIVAMGGGALLDAVGYAAATAHRGVRLVRMPTTVLAQNDAGVGVKNGVNYLDRKNYLGTFAPPYAVINDYSLLASLTDRDKRAGIAEAVKVALIKDRDFFQELYQNRFALARFERGAMESMIYRCAELHLDHIRSGDPFEMGSARPLDFGHWAAHKLEALSAYRLRHGEAVAMGIALDSLYSKQSGSLGDDEYSQIKTLLLDVGFNLSCPEMDCLDIAAALAEFREHLGGQLCITLLKGLGQAYEANDIDEALMVSCLAQINQDSSISVS